jgi:ABC-type branched-subunit amino acid transport system ATPase component
MYERLHISGFRGIQDLQIDDLRRVNLFVGPNNAGKTSVLEAAWLLRAPGNPALLLNVLQFRGIAALSQLGINTVSPTLLWTNLFHGSNTAQPISIAAHENGAREELTIRVDRGPQTVVLNGQDAGKVAPNATALPANPLTLAAESLHYQFMRDGTEVSQVTAEYGEGKITFNLNQRLTRLGVFVGTRAPINEQELAASFTRLEDAGGIDIVVSALKALDGDLRALSLGFIDGRPVIRGHFEDRRILPLYFLGDGMMRLANITLSIAAAPEGLVLIDEVENGIYYQNLNACWEAVRSACVVSNAQVFATTHSRECVAAALSIFRDEALDDFRLFRLERRAGHTRAVAYDVPTAEAAFAMDLEVR